MTNLEPLQTILYRIRDVFSAFIRGITHALDANESAKREICYENERLLARTERNVPSQGSPNGLCRVEFALHALNGWRQRIYSLWNSLCDGFARVAA